MRITRREVMLGGLTAAACLYGSNGAGFDSSPGLASFAQRTGLLYGGVISDSTLGDQAFIQANLQNCSLLTSMNEAKRPVIEPAPGVFKFDRTERMLQFAEHNGMRFRGHCLAWYRSEPAWLPPVVQQTRDMRLLTDYISTVVGHFKGRVHSWDVINEGLRPEDGRPDGLRATIWTQAFGLPHIDAAFHAARAADPNAILCFSDYGTEFDHPTGEARRTAALRLFEGLRKRNVPVDAFGMHGHIKTHGWPVNMDVLQPFLDELRGMGIKLLVTEFDVADWGGSPLVQTRDGEVADLTRRFLDLVLSYDNLQSFSTFGVSDRYSWLRGEKPTLWPFDVRPLPLDVDMQRKPMWNAIADGFSARRVRTIA